MHRHDGNLQGKEAWACPVNADFFEAKRKQLYSMYRHCMNTVSYYKARWSTNVVSESDFNYRYFCESIPVLEKSAVRGNEEALISSDFNTDQLVREHTSGTEGKPITCYKTQAEILGNAAALWARRREVVLDLSPEDKFARFYAMRCIDGQQIETNSLLYRGNHIHIPLGDLSDERLSQYWQAIMDFRPRWMHGPSTAIYHLARHVVDHKMPRYSFDLVELNGERVHLGQVELINDVFSCKTINHYGSREFWMIALSCINGHMHLLDSRLFVECVPTQNGEDREILVTTLTNRAWPLIRYRIGDIAGTEIRQNCGCCSRSKYLLKLYGGRESDYFDLHGGRRINAVLFSGLARGINTANEMSLIVQYQVTKESNCSLKIKISLSDVAKSDAEKILAEYNLALRKSIPADIGVRYEVVESIYPDVATGKVREFIDLTTQADNVQ
jgi:phenylacetate-CoA ligase